MKMSVRIAASLFALTVACSNSLATLPIYLPEYYFDNATGAGYTGTFGTTSLSELVSVDGKSAHPLRYFESNIETGYVSVAWRGQTPLPTPQLDSIHSSSFVFDINRSGWTVGRTTLPYSSTQAAMWRPDGTRIDLPHISASFPDEPAQGVAYDMNDLGVVVGQASKFESNAIQVRPVYWNSLRDVVELANPISTPGQVWTGVARTISPSGVIAGHVTIANVDYPMRWHLNGSADLLSMTTDTGMTFNSVHAERALDDGTAIGWGYTTNGRTGALWTADGEAIQLRDLSSSEFRAVEAYEINNNHYSVGFGENASHVPRAVRWSPTGEPMVLDTLPTLGSLNHYWAFDINDLNFVVGAATGGPWPAWHPILWTPDGDAIDLNTLIESDSEWKLARATTITNTGWLSGVGRFGISNPATSYDRPFSMLVPFAGTYGMGDANFDESIDFADLLIVAQNYGTQANGSFDVGDFNLDGSVNFIDLLAIAQNYGDVFGLIPASENPSFETDWQTARRMVPEPEVVGLIAIGVMLRRRRIR